jgi:FkbM family methyltransferase
MLRTIRHTIKRRFQEPTPARQAEAALMALRFAAGEIAVDCGANVGKYTEILARKGATVYAFEPNPYAFGLLRERCRKFPRVHCINKGVLDETGLMKLYLRNNSEEDPVKYSTSSSFMTYSPNLNYQSSMEIEVIDLGDFIRSLPRRVKVLKMDIEGAEYRVLRKLIATDTISLIDHAFVETHERITGEIETEAAELDALIAQRQLTNINLDWK